MNSDSPQKFFCNGRFEACGKIGEGTYGDVFYAIDTQRNVKVAVKRVKLVGNKDDGIPATSLREIAILKELKHKNIVSLEDVVTHVEDGVIRLFLVFRMMDIDLKTAITMYKGKIKADYIKHVMKQIIEGVNFLHSNKILHRDIKPENVLLCKEGYGVKICDFGLSRTIHQPLRPYSEEVLTLWYRAPELCVSNRSYSIGIDTWAIGCVMVELVTGKPLFVASTPLDLLFEIVKVVRFDGSIQNDDLGADVQKSMKSIHDRVQQERRLEEILENFEQAGVDLVKKFLRLDPLKRFTCKQALVHDYFRELNE